MARNRLKVVAETGFAIVFWLLVWHLLSVLVGQEILLPSPWTVAKAAVDIVVKPDFWRIVGLSVLRILLGFLAALAVGGGLAVLTVKSRLCRVLFTPILKLVRAAPVASFIILALVWIADGRVPAFIAFLMVVPIVWANVAQGIEQTDRKLLEMATVYRIGRWRTFWKIWVPSVLPYFMAACTTGLGFAWKSGVAAEVICRPEFSIGSQLNDAKTYLETPDMFVWTAAVIVLSVLFEKLFVKLAAVLQKRWFVDDRKGASV